MLKYLQACGRHGLVIVVVVIVMLVVVIAVYSVMNVSIASANVQVSIPRRY
jgi:hypothetical protein